jgi:hypothetical protein
MEVSKMADDDVTITWWLWEAEHQGSSIRVVLEVRTLVTETGEVNTPVGYFPESDSGGGVDAWVNRIMIEAEAFARYRAQGAIKPLPTTPIAPIASGD